ncbi:hypothetical protein [Aequorivita sp. Q41]|uniref:hypothetical protein n=1 Tax=Aequorivita sp. Q41 TaxID=3153300 RepID=UPI0032427B11
MNNKFIRVLVIINGILIPVFIIIIVTSIVIREFKSSNGIVWDDEKYMEQVNEFEVRYNSPQKVPNAENYYVAIRKIYAD